MLDWVLNTPLKTFRFIKFFPKTVLVEVCISGISGSRYIAITFIAKKNLHMACNQNLHSF